MNDSDKDGRDLTANRERAFAATAATAAAV